MKVLDLLVVVLPYCFSLAQQAGCIVVLCQSFQVGAFLMNLLAASYTVLQNFLYKYKRLKTVTYKRATINISELDSEEIFVC